MSRSVDPFAVSADRGDRGDDIDSFDRVVPGARNEFGQYIDNVQYER